MSRLAFVKSVSLPVFHPPASSGQATGTPGIAGVLPPQASRFRLVGQVASAGAHLQRLWTDLQFVRETNPSFLGYAMMAAASLAWLTGASLGEGTLAGFFFASCSTKDAGNLKAHYQLLQHSTNPTLLREALEVIGDISTETPGKAAIDEARSAIDALIRRSELSLDLRHYAYCIGETFLQAIPEQYARTQIRDAVRAKSRQYLRPVEVEAVLLQLLQSHLADWTKVQRALFELESVGPWDLRDLETFGTSDRRLDFLTRRLQRALPVELRAAVKPVPLVQRLEDELALNAAEASALLPRFESLFAGRMDQNDLLADLLALNDWLSRALERQWRSPSPQRQSRAEILGTIFAWSPRASQDREVLTTYLAFYREMKALRDQVADAMKRFGEHGSRLQITLWMMLPDAVQIPMLIDSLQEIGSDPWQWQGQIEGFAQQLRRLGRIADEATQVRTLLSAFDGKNPATLTELTDAIRAALDAQA